jgi:hypothetical protein
LKDRYDPDRCLFVAAAIRRLFDPASQDRGKVMVIAGRQVFEQAREGLVEKANR